VGDFPIIDVATGFTHLEPSHVANGFFARPSAFWTASSNPFGEEPIIFNFFVNMFSHARIISCRRLQKTKKPEQCLESLSRRRGPPPARRPVGKFALQKDTTWGSLAWWEDRSQSALCWQSLSVAYAVRTRKEN